MKPDTMVLIVSVFIGAMIAMMLFPRIGLFIMHMINQLKGWFKIVMNSILSGAMRGGNVFQYF